MTAIEVISVPLSVLATGIFFDLALNGGDGMSSIFKAIRGHKEEKIDDKTKLVRDVLEELDDLRDDLTYDNSPEEKEAIVNKIKDREKILEKLL